MDSIITESDDLQESADSILGTIAKIVSPPLSQASLSPLLQRFYLQSLARELLPDERVSKCLRVIIPTRTHVEIIYDPRRQKAHFKNLITCGRLWQCSVCATRITEHRAAELLEAVTAWTQEGGFVALVTYTLRHKLADDLLALVAAAREAHRKFKMGAPAIRMRERYNWHGSVTALEVTYGDNGWHPHLHELVFFTPLASTTWVGFAAAAKQRWLKVLESEGRDATWKHGLDVRDAESDVYDYVAKFGKLPSASRWTLEREVAKAPTKRGHTDGRTPFQLLQDYGDGDLRAGALFQEYAAAFKGRNQLVWSRGLRDELGMGKEAADDDIAADLPDDYVLLASLTAWHWKQLMRLPDDIRGPLLEVAKNASQRDLQRFLLDYGIYLEVADNESPSYP